MVIFIIIVIFVTPVDMAEYYSVNSTIIALEDLDQIKIQISRYFWYFLERWVSIFLLAMAILFYVPRMIWLTMEGGLMAFLCTGCHGDFNHNI